MIKVKVYNLIYYLLDSSNSLLWGRNGMVHFSSVSICAIWGCESSLTTHPDQCVNGGLPLTRTLSFFIQTASTPSTSISVAAIQLSPTNGSSYALHGGQQPLLSHRRVQHLPSSTNFIYSVFRARLWCSTSIALSSILPKIMA